MNSWNRRGDGGTTQLCRTAGMMPVIVALSLSYLAAAAPAASDESVMVFPPASGVREPAVRSGRDTTITVTSPIGGEIWAAGTERFVTWNATDPAGDVQISLFKNGLFHDEIGSASMASGAFTWWICEDLGNGTDYTVRVACIGCDPPVEDFSDGPFEITGSAVPTLTVTYPNGGEVWTAGSTQTITWSTTNPSDYVDIWLFKAGQRDTFIAQVPMEDASFNWDVCRFVGDGGDYSVRLTWVNHCGPVELEDFSNATFSITGSLPLPTLTVTSPNGGEVWAADTTQSITWDSTDPVGHVEIWLTESTASNRTRYDYLGSAPTTHGQFAWPILPCVRGGADYSILLRWSACGRSVEDLSDAPFEIIASSPPTLSITSPAGGENWLAGATHTITWDSTSTNGEVDVELYRGSYPLAHLGRVPISDGALEWEICPAIGDGSPGGDYAIHLSMGQCATRVQSGPFSITGSVPGMLTLTSPGVGDSWPAGAPRTITWNTNLTGYVDIYLSDNTDSYWGRESVPASQGYYVWYIPPWLSGALVKIKSYGCDPWYGWSDSEPVNISAPVTPPGDFDADGDVDLPDFARLQACFTARGPWILNRPCNFFDFEPDADVDLDDYYVIQAALTGPAVGFGDVDLDGDVDLGDFCAFVECLGGPGVSPNPSGLVTPQTCLRAFDFDEDDDVDLWDFDRFQQAFTGS